MTRPPEFPTGQVVRIVVLIVLIVAIIVMKQRCGSVTAQLFRNFDVPQSADGGLTSPDAPRK